MKPALAFPYHDPDQTMLPRLQAALPDLKEHFDRAYYSPSPSTQAWLERDVSIFNDDFFTGFPSDEETLVGKRLAHLYQRTAETAPPAQPVHLCFPDRLTFALSGAHRESLLADVDSLSAEELPIIFQRSEYAWSTHPNGYRTIEGIVITAGKNLFGRELDYCWCHIAATAEQLGRIIPLVKNPDISMVAEIIYYLRDEIHTRDVDWLAWEDPFVFNRDADELRREREQSLAETQKRLAYVLPMIETLTRFAGNGRHPGFEA
jgi:hypothetical protein